MAVLNQGSGICEHGVFTVENNETIPSRNQHGLHAGYLRWFLPGICCLFREVHGYFKENTEDVVHSTSSHSATFLEVSGSISNETSH